MSIKPTDVANEIARVWVNHKNEDDFLLPFQNDLFVEALSSAATGRWFLAATNLNLLWLAHSNPESFEPRWKFQSHSEYNFSPSEIEQCVRYVEGLAARSWAGTTCKGELT